MALRVFRLISDLKIAVEVGLVVGTIPQIMPIGSAMVMVPKVSSSDSTPQVFIFIGVVNIFRSEVVLITLSSTIPIPDSATAILASGMRASAAARAAARKILSTCS